MTLLICTNEPGATAAEYRAQGWFTENIFVGRFYRTLCDGMLYAISFWRPDQGELEIERSIKP